VGSDSRHRLVRQIVVSILRHNAIAAELRLPGGVCKDECSDAEVGIARQTRRKRLGSLHKGQSGRMRSKEYLHRFWRRHVGPACGNGLEELEELISIAG